MKLVKIKMKTIDVLLVIVLFKGPFAGKMS